MKTLPIQLVEFRGAQDEFYTEGMGNNDLPPWIEHNLDMCYTNSARVHEQLCSWMPIFDERLRQQNEMPLLLEMALQEKAEAKSYRKDIYALLNISDGKSVLGMTRRRRMLMKVNNREELQILTNRFVAQRGANLSNQKLKAYASIESANLFRPTVDEYEEGKELKIKLVNYQDEHYNEVCANRLRQLCREYGQECEPLDYAPGLMLYKTTAVSHEFVSRLACMDGLRSVGGMPMYTWDEVTDILDSDILTETPEEGKDYPLVGMLDSGVANVPCFEPWKDGESQIPEEWQNRVVREHGSCVASILLYGDKLSGGKRTGTGPCKIRDCVVHIENSETTVYEADLLRNIKRAIADNPDVKVWNCSMGIKMEAPFDRISDMAIALDRLQEDNNILICKSAGNREWEYNRITHGADSLLSLVVGSTAIEATAEGPMENWTPASCVGPAAGAVIKPDLLTLGGDEYNKVKLINEYGMPVEHYGTSFSTPRISAMAADLALRLGAPFNPLLIKALLVHNTYYPKGMEDLELEETVNRAGFGVPTAIDDIIHNDENEMTMVFPCHFSKGTECRALQFIYPEGLVEDGKYYGDITITLVTRPILDSNQAAEYCQTDVDVALVTYDSVIHLDLGGDDVPKRIKNPIRWIGNQNILLEDLYSHDRRKNGGQNLFECNRIDKNHKYSPIKKFHIDLEQMKQAKRDTYLASHRKWALTLKPLYRQEIQNEVAKEDLVFDAYLLMTIRDPKRRGVVYNESMLQLDNRNFVHRNVVIREDIVVENEE